MLGKAAGPAVWWFSPYDAHNRRHGGEIRAHNLILAARRGGAEITRIFPGSMPSSDQGGDLAYVPRGRVSRRDKLLAGLSPLPDYAWENSPTRVISRLIGGSKLIGTPDLVVLDQPHLGRLARDLAGYDVPLVYSSQNLEFELYRSMSSLDEMHLRTAARLRVEALKSKRFESHLARSAGLSIAVTDHDAEGLRRLGAKRVSIIENGVDLEYFEMQSHEEVLSERVIFTGSLGYIPNQSAVIHLVRDIFPLVRKARPEARLVVVGSRPSEAIRSLASTAPEWLDFHFNVPDVRPYVREADVFAAPLQAGGGSPLKVLEAFAMGIPVVTSSRVGTALKCPASSLLVADDAQAFASQVTRAFDAREDRRRMIASGRAHVVARHDWLTLGDRAWTDMLSLLN